jgi:acyl carrier protein
MNKDARRQTIINAMLSAIQQVAPEIEQADIAPDADLRETCDIDSMDFLNMVIALKKSTGVNVPEKDYGQIASFNKMLNYLSEHIIDT